MKDNKTVELLKFCEENDIEVFLYYGKHAQRRRGVPEYKGFNIDIGEMFEVGGHSVAAHDFRSIVIVNTDSHIYREHYT